MNYRTPDDEGHFQLSAFPGSELHQQCLLIDCQYLMRTSVTLLWEQFLYIWENKLPASRCDIPIKLIMCGTHTFCLLEISPTPNLSLNYCRIFSSHTCITEVHGLRYKEMSQIKKWISNKKCKESTWISLMSTLWISSFDWNYFYFVQFAPEEVCLSQANPSTEIPQLWCPR